MSKQKTRKKTSAFLASVFRKQNRHPTAAATVRMNVWEIRFSGFSSAYGM